MLEHFTMAISPVTLGEPRRLSDPGKRLDFNIEAQGIMSPPEMTLDLTSHNFPHPHS